MTSVGNIPVINGDFFKVANAGRILPYFKETVYCSFGKNYFSTFIDMWADSEAVCDNEIFHVEESQDCWTVTPAANATASAPGASVQITLSAADHYLSGKYSKPQEKYPVLFPGIGKAGKIIDVDTTSDGAHVITVAPNDPNYTITVTTSENLIIVPVVLRGVGNCDSSNSSSKLPGITYKSKLMNVYKELKIEGRDLAKWCDKLFLYPMRDPLDPCKVNQVWWHNELNQMMLEFMVGWSILMMMGEDNTNTGVAGSHEMTTGFMPTMRARASYQSYSLSGGIDLDDIDVITGKIKSIRNYCDEYGWWAGKNQRRDLDKILGEYFDAGAITYGAFSGDQAKSVNFGFQAFTKNGIAFFLHDESSLNDKCFLGANGFNGPDLGFLVPLCKMMCGNDVKTPIVLNYLANEKAGYSRELEQWDWGVLKPATKPDNCDNHTWALQSDKGFEQWCPERFWLIEAL